MSKQKKSTKSAPVTAEEHAEPQPQPGLSEELAGVGLIKVEARAVRIPLDKINTLDIRVKPMPAMVESIRQIGNIQPVLLVKGKDGTYIVKDGQRRVMASKEAGKKDVLALVMQVDQNGGNVVGLVANNVRGRNFYAEAKCVDALCKAHYTENDIAAATGMNLQAVRKLIRLNQKLLPALLELLGGASITASMAFRLSTFSTEIQEKIFIQYMQDGKITNATLAPFARARADKQVSSIPDEIFDEIDKQGGAEKSDVIAKLAQEVIADLRKKNPSLFKGGTSFMRLEKALKEISNA